MPEELGRRETRIERIREAKRGVEERAREEAAAQGKGGEEVQPTEKAQYNFTDPESRIMKGPEGFVQAYNAQLAVEAKTQMIVGQTVTPAVNDKQPVKPRVKVIEAQAGQKPKALLIDSGYGSEDNLRRNGRSKATPPRGGRSTASGARGAAHEVRFRRARRGSIGCDASCKRRRERRCMQRGRGSSNRFSGRSNRRAGSANFSCGGWRK